MFLYAKLVLSNLYNQPNQLSLEEEIRKENFPKELGDAYAYYNTPQQKATITEKLTDTNVSSSAFEKLRAIKSGQSQKSFLAGWYAQSVS
jgi:hypothetical protein